jgi:hypothetical protein
MRSNLHHGRLARLSLAAALVIAQTSSALAHGFAADRFFPTTILSDDPFVADEMSLPTVTLDPTASDGSRELGIGRDLSMLITPTGTSPSAAIGSIYAPRACIRGPGSRA